MNTASTSELDAALAAARRPIEPPPMPPAPLRVRLKTWAPLRGLLAPLVLHRAQAHGRAAWERDPAARERALCAMQAIVAGTPRAGEVAELARQRLIEEDLHRALFWQPWQTASMDANSTANLQKALTDGRGVLLSSCHLGPIFLHISAICARGRVVYTAAGPWFFERPSPDLWGLRTARWWQQLRRRDQRLVCSSGAFPVLRALLEQREVVALYFDMPGSSRTHFLGKPVMLSSGSARLAVQSDALILPIRARRSARRVWTDVHAPLDPRDYSDADLLHGALAAVHSRWILELPATLEDPNRDGAWEGGASAQEWAPTRTANRTRRSPNVTV